MTAARAEADDANRAEGTRARLLDAAMLLFAERGYRGTTVGEIEAAAGLAPRSGALYQHFAGKEEVLRAAVERHVASLGRMQSATEMLPLGDLRAELLLIGRWNLADLAQRQPLYRFVAKEGDRFPDIRDRVYATLVDGPLRRVAAWMQQLADEAGVEPPDTEALVLILVQSMSNYRWLETLYGRPPLDVDEERFLATWVEVCLAVIGQHVPLERVTTATPTRRKR